MAPFMPRLHQLPLSIDSTVFALTHNLHDTQANLTKATLVQDYELMLNKTKAALAGLETLADELAAAKSAKLNKAAKSVKLNKAAKSVKLNKTATLKPGMSAAHSAKVASFAQADAGAKPDAVVSLDCSDEAPKDAQQFTCQQQRDWGKCGEGWMVATAVFKHGYCAKTCGRC